MISGIYKITNTKNDKVYVGQSKNVMKRLKNHKSSLIRGRHNNKLLQNSVNKYGIESFRFELLTESCVGLMDSVEKFFISKNKVIKRSMNIEDGGNINKTIPQTSRQKMSISKLGKPQHKNSCRNRPVVCLESGIIWESALEASNIYGINYWNLIKWLEGKSKNKSKLRYL